MHADKNYKTMYKDISVYRSPVGERTFLESISEKSLHVSSESFFCSVCFIKIEGKTDRTAEDWLFIIHNLV